MTENPISPQEYAGLLDRGLVGKALDRLENIIRAYPQLRPLASEVTALREQYGYMADYALQGLPDPGLPQAHDDIKGRVMALVDRADRAIRTIDAPSLYYSMVRTRQSLSHYAGLAEAADEYRQLLGKLATAPLSEDADRAVRNLTPAVEEAERHMFCHLWTTHPLTRQDVEATAAMLSDPAIPDSAKSLLISGLTLGLTEWWDERKMRLLFDVYTLPEADTEMRVRALCGMLIAMWQYRDRAFSLSLTQRFDAMAEEPAWPGEVRIATMQFIKARDTERLTRKFNDEILPGMMKLRPEIEKLKQQKPIDPNISPEEIGDFIEENPEWAELLDKSGLSDRLKEMQELQEDGGDVMMATFSRLKTFPFFHDVANWFLPFRPDHSALKGHEDSTLGAVIDILGGKSGPLCDSDRYSLALSLSEMPQAQRDMLAGQLSAQAEALEQLRNAGMMADTAPVDFENASANYVRSLYRFFKLFRRKGEFHDPFAQGMNLPSHPMLKYIFDDAATLRLIGEFYFKRHYYTDAIDIFSRLDMLATPSAELYQKMGYCLEALGNNAEALRYYEQSEMLRPDSEWTIGRIAECHVRAGRHRQAAQYLRRVAESHPDDPRLALRIGQMLLADGKTDEAIREFYRAEYLGADSPEAIRQIGWAMLLTGDLDKASQYISRGLNLPGAGAEEHLAAGHLAMLTGHPDKAAAEYASAIAALDFDESVFDRLMSRHRQRLGALDANPRLMQIALDRAYLIASQQGNRI